MAEKRKDLIPIMKELRNRQNHAILKYDKLVVNGKIWDQSDSSNFLNEKKGKHPTMILHRKQNRIRKLRLQLTRLRLGKL